MKEIVKNDYEVAQKYLSRFGSPEVFCLKTTKETGGDDKKIGRKFHHKRYPLKQVMQINVNYPIGVSYTPN